MLTRISCMDALLPEPVVETGVAEAGVILGDEGVFARRDAEVARVRIGDDLARIVALLQYPTDELVEAELFGPAISTMPFTGGPTTTRASALATSSAAMGWMSAGASRTVLRSAAASAMPFMNSKNCVAWTIE